MMTKPIAVGIFTTAILFLSGCETIEDRSRASYNFLEINYFVSLTTSLQYDHTEKPLGKWVKPIRIAIGGNPSEEDRAVVRQIVDEWSDLLGEMDVWIVEEDPNFVIHFIPLSEVGEIFPGRPAHTWTHFNVSRGSKTNQYTGAKIAICHEITNKRARKTAIRALMTRCLGLVNIHKDYPGALFSGNIGKIQPEYSRMDKTMIRMLYRNEVKPGMTAAELEELFRALPRQ